MPFIEFSKVEDVSERLFIPGGTYTVLVEDVRERRTGEDQEMWRVGLRITKQNDGNTAYHGQRVYDNWVFSEKAMPHIKLITSRFGIDITEDREISPGDFLGKEIDVELRIRKRVYNGETRFENIVTFAGYRRRGESVAEKNEAPF